MFVIKTNLPRKLLKVWAISIWPFIFVVPDHSDNQPLLAHEKLHGQEQIKQFVVVWWIRYLFSRQFRQSAEIRAYKLQINMGGCTADQAAKWLSSNYKLKLTKSMAYDLLVK